MRDRRLSSALLATLLVPVLAAGCDSAAPPPTTTLAPATSEAVPKKPKELVPNPKFKGQRVELPGPRK